MRFGGLIATLFLAAILTSTIPNQSRGGEADVVEVEFVETDDGNFDFIVTVSHADTGWDHYAERWEVVDVDGTILGERVLLHPHVNEQPFTRSLGGVRIPADVNEVRIRAYDKVHGWGGKEITVRLKP